MEQLSITIFNENYSIERNGIIFLVKKDSMFELFIQDKEEINYKVERKRISDFSLLPFNRKFTDFKWGIFLLVDKEFNVQYLKKCILKIRNCTINIKFDNGISDGMEQVINVLLQPDLMLKEICREYIENDNYLIDVKKFLCPYNEDIVEKIRQSGLQGCIDKYKIVARKKYMYQVAALNEYKKLIEKEKWETYVPNISTLDAFLANIKDRCVDIVYKKYNGYNDCFDSYLEELNLHIGEINHEKLLPLIENEKIYRYFLCFFEQNFYKQLQARIRVKPEEQLCEIHMGKNWNLSGINVRSLYIAPRLQDLKWENDKSEIRRAEFNYFTIGHLLTTGLVVNINNKRKIFRFNNFEDYIPYLYPKDELEKDEEDFVCCYIDYIKSHNGNINNIPLLIPQFRFDGLDEKYKYRADFMIFNYLHREGVTTVLIELSRNKTHIDLGEKDAIRRNDFVAKYKCITLEIRDSEMKDMKKTFNERIIKMGYLE